LHIKQLSSRYLTLVHAGVYVFDVVLVITDKGKFKNNTETKLVHQETKTCVTNTAQYIYPCNVAN